MHFFNRFPQKTLSDITSLLVQYNFERVERYLVKLDDSYTLIDNISLCPNSDDTFALACVLASLGNPQLASKICASPERFIEPGYGEYNTMLLECKLRNVNN